MENDEQIQLCGKKPEQCEGITPAKVSELFLKEIA